VNTKEVGQKLVDYVRSGQTGRALDELYSRDIVSVEAAATPEFPAEMRGIDQVRGKNDKWFESNVLHSATVEGPFPHKDKFAVNYGFDVTPKAGPMAGKRFQMKEVAVYTVRDGRIVREEFFYDM
jgi:ketosteroid isomerase-like protein